MDLIVHLDGLHKERNSRRELLSVTHQHSGFRFFEVMQLNRVSLEHQARITSDGVIGAD
jgi:hypothetical protein